MRRPFIDREMPDVYSAMTKASAASRKASNEAGLDEGADLDGLAEAASAHLTRAQIAAVQWTTTLINAFNRISIASGHPALTVKE